MLQKNRTSVQNQR